MGFGVKKTAQCPQCNGIGEKIKLFGSWYKCKKCGNKFMARVKPNVSPPVQTPQTTTNYNDYYETEHCHHKHRDNDFLESAIDIGTGILAAEVLEDIFEDNDDNRNRGFDSNDSNYDTDFGGGDGIGGGDTTDWSED